MYMHGTVLPDSYGANLQVLLAHFDVLILECGHGLIDTQLLAEDTDGH